MKNKKPFSGLAYAAAVLNPFSDFVSAQDDATGLRFFAYKRDVVGRTIFRTGRYDQFLSDWLIDRFSGGAGIFVDIGANLGYFSCLFGHLAGIEGRVLSIEPEPDNCSLLLKNLALNGIKNVKTLPIALGAENGEASLNIYKASNRGRHSMVAPGSGRVVSVPVRRLDDVVDEILKPDEEISFLKMDVEGYEPFVVKGGERTLGRTKLMVVEYAPYILKSISNEVDGFLDTLQRNFSKVYLISDGIMKKIDFADIKSTEGAVDLLLEK